MGKRLLSLSRNAFVFAAASFVICTLPTQAQSDWTDRFQIHGFLTQGYADASFSDLGPTSQEVILGIPEEGTTNYRFLALQFRYQISDQDIVLVQLSSRSLGDSPINDVEDDIELDWAFYERRLTDNTSLKVGRIQIPLGIFNEIRDVGTILPFYRPSFMFYNEGIFTSETVDGVLINHIFAPESDWSLEADLWYGEYELIEAGVLVLDETPKIARAEDAFGFQLWLNTPVQGLRFGLGGQQRDVTEGQEGFFRPIGEATEFDDWYASIDLAQDRFTARAEYREISAELVTPGFTSDSTSTVYYVQLGYHFGENWQIFVESARNEVEQLSSSFTGGGFDYDYLADDGIALGYRFSPNVVLKYEYHRFEEALLDFAPVFLPGGGVLLDPVITDSEDGNYSILSLAVTF